MHICSSLIDLRVLPLPGTLMQEGLRSSALVVTASGDWTAAQTWWQERRRLRAAARQIASSVIVDRCMLGEEQRRRRYPEGGRGRESVLWAMG